MEYILQAPRDFVRIKQIDSFCLPNIENITKNDSVVIDLSAVNFIKPLGVIGVLVLVESITKIEKKRAPSLRIKAPKDNEVLDYLLKVDFINALKSLGKWKIPEGIKATGQRIKPVIPITRFHNSQEIEDIANTMQETFHTEFAGLTTLLQPAISYLANWLIMLLSTQIVMAALYLHNSTITLRVRG